MKNYLLLISFTLLLSSYTYAENNQDPYGGRSVEQIQSSFDEHSKSIFSIYEKELEVKPDLNGKINFMITIKNSGEVSSCGSDQKESEIGLLAKKVCSHILSMNFGKGEEFELPYLINFFPE